jgi:hypothetical protein
MNVRWLLQKQHWSLQFSVLRSHVLCVSGRATFGSFAGVGKRWLQNWKLKKYKIINSSGKVSNFNFILKTNFLLANLY